MVRRFAALFLGLSAALFGAGCAFVPAAPPIRERLGTPNYRAGPAGRARGIDAIVIHTTEGTWKKELSFAENQARVYASTQDWFLNKDAQVSAHFVISGEGEITRMVPDADIAWHATYYNSRSIGIECAGWSDRPETWTPRLLDSLARLVAWLCWKHGVPCEQPEGDAVQGPFGFYAKHGVRGFNAAGIVGHCQVQTKGSELVRKKADEIRSDPGPYFPWPEFIRRVKALRSRGRVPDP